ncbi:MAG TPA: hypothetical protein VGS98_17335 [Thermoanaerobaculia bacterium]|jgi:hypothetical protein|nr:hypothetical protein [Thermoanaerobaculia bacterium]
MLPRLAEAIESLFGGRLAPAAGFVRGTAVAALVLAIAIPLLRAALSFTAYRYGWELAPVVRCPKCRRLAADPEVRTCPAGHPIRFPSGAVGRERRRRRFQPLRRAAASYRYLLPIVIALFAVLGFRACGVARVEGSLATFAASAGYLFFAAALALGGLALSAKPRGPAERLLHAGTAALCLLPAMVLALLARGFEPPRPRVIGHLWSTPTALYLSTGARARRVGDPRMEMEALLVDARAPAFGVVWEGLEGLRSGERVVKWKGRGGTTARLLSRWAGPLSRRGIFLARSTQMVPLPANVKVWIVSEPGKVRFTTQPELDLTPPAPEPQREPSPPRRSGRTRGRAR